MSATVKFICHGCGEPVVVDSDRVRLTLDAAATAVVVILETCNRGHASEQRLRLAEDAHVIQALIDAGIQIPDGGDVEAHLTTVTDAAAWLDSPAFDADRALLRLIGGAA